RLDGTSVVCVSHQIFQRNVCEPVYRTSMTFPTSRLNFFLEDWITVLECIGWLASRELPICSKSRLDRSMNLVFLFLAISGIRASHQLWLLFLPGAVPCGRKLLIGS